MTLKFHECRPNMNDAQKKVGVLPSPKEECTHAEVPKIFKQYDKNKTGAIEVSFKHILVCMNLHPR